MANRFAWVLNLDADLELEGGYSYSPSDAVRRAMEPHIWPLARSLLGPNDVLIQGSANATGCVGRAFCPTPRALAALRNAGADPEPAPPYEVLRKVNSRAFAMAMGPTLPGSAFVTERSDVEIVLGLTPSVGTHYRLKRAYGMAGRGQRVVDPNAVTADDWQFIEKALELGGVQMEPNVTIEVEFAIHGFVSPNGDLKVGRLVRQYCERGVWQRSEPLAENSGFSHVADRMKTEVRDVATALSQAGYFGPFGIDAYTYRTAKNVLSLQRRSEINARYTMGFAMGFGAQSRG